MSQSEPPLMHSASDWDDRYRDGDLPWDTGRPSAELLRVLADDFVRPCRAIDLGCGTGTNAIHLAEQGFHVTAVDISALAIDRARQKAQSAAVRVDFFVADVTALPADKPYDFVFDRGCYHCVRRNNLPGYRAALERLTRAGSKVLLLAGNANDPSTEPGPPRVAEQEIRTEFDHPFILQWIRPFRFENPDGNPGPLGWSVGLLRGDA